MVSSQMMSDHCPQELTTHPKSVKAVELKLIQIEMLGFSNYTTSRLGGLVLNTAILQYCIGILGS